MAHLCTNCGSRNHKAIDCNQPRGAWTPPPAVIAVPEAKSAGNQGQRTAIAILGADEEPVFEPKLRWPGAPAVCTAENRMAFGSRKELDAYLDRYAPHSVVDRTWLCQVCGKTHHEGHTPAPSQDGHRSPLPEGFVPFVRKQARASAFVHTDFLPVKQDPKEEVKQKRSVALPRRDAKKEGMLI